MRLLTPALLASAAALASCATVAPTPVACADLPAALGALKNVRLTSAKEVPADDKGTPAHCQVQGLANERTGLDGRPYAIGFEMRLPMDWNRRFVHQVNGGNDGKIVPALGALPVLPTNALQRGFAVISSDSGHSEDAPANAAAGLAKGNVFGQDPQARRDYGYSANDTMFTVAQQLMRSRYGRAPERNYMIGCSNGGRHGLVAASRFGERYDGILAGAPGFNLPKAAVQHAWDVQSWQLAHADIRQAFSPADMQLVARHVLARCDALDGLADGIVGDLAACQPQVDIAAVQCAGAKTAECLSEPQVRALKRSLAGPRNSAGEMLYSDWSWDAGLGAGNWRFWKLESQIPPWDKLPLIATMGAGSLSYIFTTPPTATAGTPAELLAFLTRFDFDRDAPKIRATSGAFNESAMAFMTPPDVDNPQLSSFRAHGGKLLVYHGNSDAVFSVNDTRRWVDKLVANGGADTVRFYGVPGMAHCSGGPATDQFDALGALVDWVEQGRAPQALVARVNPANKELPADWAKDRSRPLCPHPQVARYSGGPADSASSFRCVAP
ncbi:tannase/feruloyl esterase family alpha/beta hydrolase [Ideonella sp. 4Y11]|uniref:Tannase/feruloyl esterase family alpha/beta hydrolase n=1 Tax=Ideonella aquatica TaxID=2824119 RepID=A0A940YSD0_9BURK|nr:tannase/feruloyl esterase family alpha/beta hydrolase [Ideonella aquatica]MBQ0958510.1 tannase/feruloyl esterase family alpha/beta hydrolase [Ideonella aquatica]